MHAAALETSMGVSADRSDSDERCSTLLTACQSGLRRPTRRGQRLGSATRISDSDQRLGSATRTSDSDQRRGPSTRISDSDQRLGPAIRISDADQRLGSLVPTRISDSYQRLGPATRISDADRTSDSDQRRGPAARISGPDSDERCTPLPPLSRQAEGCRQTGATRMSDAAPCSPRVRQACCRP
jgi:hypothetical protein